MTGAEFLWAALGSSNGWYRFERPGEAWLVPVWKRHGFVRVTERLAYPGDASVNLVPLLDMDDWRFHGHSSVVWVRTETQDACARLAKFDPSPSLVLREGGSCRQLALWALRKPLSVEDAERANARLSYSLGTKLKHGSAGFRAYLPGTILREGRSRPCPVHVVGGTRDLYSVGPITRRLKDRPEPRDWRAVA